MTHCMPLFSTERPGDEPGCVVWNSGYTTDPLAKFSSPMLALSRPHNGAFVIEVVHRLTP